MFILQVVVVVVVAIGRHLYNYRLLSFRPGFASFDVLFLQVVVVEVVVLVVATVQLQSALSSLSRKPQVSLVFDVLILQVVVVVMVVVVVVDYLLYKCRVLSSFSRHLGLHQLRCFHF